jgi:hypothetical protein
MIKGQAYIVPVNSPGIGGRGTQGVPASGPRRWVRFRRGQWADSHNGPSGLNVSLWELVANPRGPLRPDGPHRPICARTLRKQERASHPPGDRGGPASIRNADTMPRVAAVSKSATHNASQTGQDALWRVLDARRRRANGLALWKPEGRPGCREIELPCPLFCPEIRLPWASGSRPKFRPESFRRHKHESCWTMREKPAKGLCGTVNSSLCRVGYDA